MALVVCAPRAGIAAEPIEITDDARRDAGCIDAYNDPKHVDPDEIHFRRNAILVRLRPEGVAAAATSDATAAVRGIGYGARLDGDGVLSLLSSTATDTGLAIGISGIASIVPDRSRRFTGELRLGAARRKYGVAWSTASERCMRQREDFGVDLLRWRLGAFTDLSAATHPTTFASSVGVPGVTYRRMYPRWGFGVTAALEFRVTPSFEVGANGGLEFYYRWAVLSVALDSYVAPHPSVMASLGLGIQFELFGAP